MSFIFPFRQERINNPALLDEQDIQRKLDEGARVIVQFSQAGASDAILAKLNSLCQKHDANFALRFYSHHFDCKLLRKVPDVKNLYLDCLVGVEHISELYDLRFLEKLTLGIYQLKEPDLLSSENLCSLKELVVTEMSSAAFNLGHLQHLQDLKVLVIGGHTRNIDAIGELAGLERLGLNSIKKAHLQFVNRLKKLKALSIVLGGRADINEIKENEIEKLEIVWVRGFNDLPNISRFRKLAELRIEDQIKLEALEFDDTMPFLQDVKIINCKNLSSVRGLQHLPALRQIRLAMTAIDSDEFLSQTMPGSLENIGIYAGSGKKNAVLRSKVAEKGYGECLGP